MKINVGGAIYGGYPDEDLGPASTPWVGEGLNMARFLRHPSARILSADLIRVDVPIQHVAYGSHLIVCHLGERSVNLYGRFPIAPLGTRGCLL